MSKITHTKRDPQGNVLSTKDVPCVPVYQTSSLKLAGEGAKLISQLKAEGLDGQPLLRRMQEILMERVAKDPSLLDD